MHADARMSPSCSRSHRSSHAAAASGALPGGVALTLAAGPDAPTLARRAIDGALAHWEPERRDAALLVISELVTNAVRHGSRDASDSVGLSVQRRGRTTRIEVTDQHAGGGAFVIPDARREDQRGGWGLPIVAELTDRWGVERGDARTCVWCELDDA